MDNHVQVDTGRMQATAQGASNIASNMVNQARTLRAGVDFVRQNWTGQAGDAFRAVTQDQHALLDQLINKLQFVAELVKRGAQGFDGHDANSRTKLATPGQQFLNGSLNHHH
jgi:WXG100 family type VII secretion target